MVKRHLLLGLIILAGLGLACNLPGGQSPTSVPTATSTATWTPPPPAGPAEPAASPTPTPPAPTITDQPTATPSSTTAPEISPTAAATPTLAPTATPTPPDTPVPSTPTTIPPPPTPTSTPTSPPLDCTTLPSGSFLTIWESDLALQLSLDCPTSNHPSIVPEAWQVQTSYQPFENGQMIWSNQIGWYAQPVIYVLYANGTYARYDDTYDPAVDPVSGGEQPPPNLFEPILGFGKLWREGAGVRASLGWATTEEILGSGRFQLFLGGEMVWLSQTGLTTVFEHAGHAVHTFSIPFSP